MISKKKYKTDCCYNCEYCRINKMFKRAKRYDYTCCRIRIPNRNIYTATHRTGWCKYHIRLKDEREHEILNCKDGDTIEIWKEQRRKEE